VLAEALDDAVERCPRAAANQHAQAARRPDITFRKHIGASEALDAASPWLSLQCSVQAEGTARIVTVAASIGTTDANHDGSERLHAACDRGFAVDFRHQAISLSEHDAPGRRNTEFEALRNPVGAIDEGIG